MNLIEQKIYERFYSSDHARMIAQGKIPDPGVSLKRVKKLGFNPGVIYDVGAYQGDFTDVCLNLWPASEIHAFEALPEKFPSLSNRFLGKNVKLNNVLVGEIGGFVIYDVCEIHRRPLDNALTQIDFLFVKEDSPFRTDKKWDKI